jgi:hypothetical protein
MIPSLQRILESKHALHRELASRPVAEKLRMLEAMRERTVAIRAGGEETPRSSTRAK